MSEYLLPGSAAANVDDRPLADADQFRKGRVGKGGVANQRDISLSEFGQTGAADVFGGRHCFQVLRSDACGDTTKMVNVHSTRNRPYRLLIGRTMCELGSSIDGDTAIAVRRGCSSANPARRRMASIFFTPMIRRDSWVAMQVADMPSDEPNVLSSNVPDLPIGFLRNRRDLAAPAFAVHSCIVTNALDGA